MVDYSHHDIDRPTPPEQYHPTVTQWQALQHDLLRLYDDKVPLGGNRRQFWEPFYTLWLIRFGAVEIERDGADTIRVDAGNWILVPPFFQHSQTFTVGARILSIHYYANWPNGTGIFRLESPLVVPHAEWCDLEKLLLDLIRHRRDPDAAVPLAAYGRAESALLAFLGRWYVEMTRHGYSPEGPEGLDSRLQKAIDYLDGTEYTGAIPYARLARDIGISRTHLDRLFKEQLGKTPRKYLEDRVIHRVVKDLVTTRKTIATICYDHGFVSASHFCRWFRRVTGRSPREYREGVGGWHSATR